MTRLILCRRHQREMEGLEAPPFPGPKGQEIFESTSKQAWQEWIARQTRLINEKHLTATDPKARQYLAEQRDKFLTGAPDADEADGYVPSKPSS